MARRADARCFAAGLTVFERGWLSSNNILFTAADQTALVDSGYATHAAQTVALVARRSGAAARPLINTHLHSDHCGGNAALQRAYRCADHDTGRRGRQGRAGMRTALTFAPPASNARASVSTTLPGGRRSRWATCSGRPSARPGTIRIRWSCIEPAAADLGRCAVGERLRRRLSRARWRIAFDEVGVRWN